MKKAVLILFAFLLVAAISGCQTASEGTSPEQRLADAVTGVQQKLKPASSDFLTYEDKDYGVEIDYKSDWELKESEQSVFAFVSPGSPQASLNLVMNDLSGQGLDLESYSQTVLSQLGQIFEDAELLESGYTTMGSEQAYKVVYTTGSMKFMQVWTIKDDISYILTYGSQKDAYADHLGTIQKMIDSFEITHSVGAQQEAPEEEVKAEAKTGTNNAEASAPATTDSTTVTLLGSWRVYSERIYYDIGGGGALGIPTTRRLELLSGGRWKFGDSEGKFTVPEITGEDWARWGVNSYGPSRKIILDGWNGATADGPIEETAGQVDFIWVIYHVEPPTVQNPGTVWLKFGH